MRRPVLVAVMTTASLLIPAFATANGVSLTSKRVTGASTTVSSCGSLAALTASWLVTANVVTSVTLASIPAACSGATLSMTLAGAGNTSLGSVSPTAVNATSQTFAVTGSPTATSVTSLYVAVTGP